MAQISVPPTKIERVFPAKKYEVIKELQVIEIKKRTGKPFFLATLFIPEMLWTTRMPDLDEVLDNYCRYQAGNTTRVFLFPSSWDAKYNNWAKDIFHTNKLLSDFINPEWEKQVIERIKMVVSRRIMLVVSLWDNCSFHLRQPGFWSENFLNPENNDLNTSDDNHAYWKYASESSLQMQNTGYVVETLTRHMLNVIYDKLTPKERKYIAIETCNEGYSGTAWHMRMKDIIDETWGKACPRWRRFTSTEAETSEKTRRFFTPVIHQIGDMGSYLDKVLLMAWYSCGISTDGWKEKGEYAPVPIPVQTAKRLLKRAYADGHVLMETLNGHRDVYWRVPKPGQKYYNHSKIRWPDMRKMGKLLLRLSK